MLIVEDGDKTKEIFFGTLSAIDFTSKKKNPHVHEEVISNDQL